MPGPWSRTVSTPSRERHLHARRRPYLAALSSRLATARSSRAAHALDDDRLELGGERARPARSGGRARPPPPTSSSSAHTSCSRRAPPRGRGRRGRRRAASAPRAGRSGRPAAARGPRASPPRASTSRLVRSEVSGVRSSCEASATSRRCARWDVVERLEHRVERAGQARELVVAVALDPAGEVVGPGDVLGRVGQLRHGLDRRAGGEPARAPSAAAMPSSDDQPRPRRSVRSVASTSASGPRDLERAPAGSRRGEDPHLRRRRASTSARKAGRLPSATASSSSRPTSVSNCSPGAACTLAALRRRPGRRRPGAVERATGAAAARRSSGRAASSPPAGAPAARRAALRWRSDASICPRSWSRTSDVGERPRRARPRRATAAAQASVRRRRKLMARRAARSRRRAPCAAAAARRPPPSCAAGSRRRPRASSTPARSRSPRRGRR